ncbi:MAG: cation diffusion facilitator family transporter [Planctomycetia bacterium]|nr:cation diffusion facilitator family transporter [Planctomycetia bacterium]
MSHTDECRKQNTIQRVTLWGALINLVLVCVKFAAGICGCSQVLIADAVHSLSDFLTDFAIVVGARYWEQPADEDHPYGHAKMETLVTLFIGAVLVVVGFRLALNAVFTLHDMIEHPAAERELPRSIALWAALISIFVKEYLYQITARVGRKVRSSALIANAWHHRSDALSSIPVAVAVACCLFWGDICLFLDPVGTILVGGMIIFAAWEIICPTLGTLMDAAATEEKVDAIRQIVRACPGVEKPHNIRTRRVGNNLDVDLHVYVDGKMSVEEGHRLSHEIEKRLLASTLGILDVIIHVEPIKHAERDERVPQAPQTTQVPQAEEPHSN